MTEGLSGVDDPFGDDLCRDSHPRRRRSAVRRYPGQSRQLSATPRRARRPRRAVPRRAKGPMPMTDVPNFETKFGRRKPCLRYIVPLLGTTCGASVGRGDYTPPSCSAPPVGGGLRPAPLARSVFLPISVGSEYLPISCRGGPMCPPGHAFLRDPPTGRHAGRPLQILLQSSSTPRNRAGTEPRPYSRRTSNAGSRSTRPSSLSSSARRRSARNDRRHQGLPLPSHVPTSPVSAKRPRSSFGKSPVTVTPGWFPKEGPKPFLWSFQGGCQGENRNPP